MNTEESQKSTTSASAAGLHNITLAQKLRLPGFGLLRQRKNPLALVRVSRFIPDPCDLKAQTAQVSTMPTKLAQRISLLQLTALTNVASPSKLVGGSETCREALKFTLWPGKLNLRGGGGMANMLNKTHT